MVLRAGLKEGLATGRPDEISPGTRPSESEPVFAARKCRGCKRHFEQRFDDKLEWKPDAKGTGNKETDKLDS